ncbi:NAD-dependent succinate-semialdehyde dehydrogenase [Motilimonas pumila]|uniref:NAD-dependent succinate-semialdehyde dehydrogenase n=1 Tax=Motilimonas pumila TaxID=2303987 RepID=A0A418YIA5_9GAMM|nr:NAD-dependent succinate-semialdehyde dehydrogenase [Motilimonas pumila]RJG50059.1 NAD-dependent succinate-semialdehyde dehydrogenase [Motilimonas pumila]
MNFAQLKQPDLIKQACYVNGQWLTTESRLDVFNPANGEQLGHIPCLNPPQVEQAIHSAQQAFNNNQESDWPQRCQQLLRWHQLIMEHKSDLAFIICLEQGKPLNEALAEIEYAASFVRWFADFRQFDHGETLASPLPNKQFQTQHAPLGVVAMITPWNFPAAMVLRKAAAALAAGCTLVIKASELTPFTANALVELAHQAGFPAGVINIVSGDAAQIGLQFCQHGAIKKLSFTGSTRVGKILMTQSAPQLQRLSLELGGNAPFIVFEDADLDAAVAGLIASKLRNNGQTCVASNRIYIAKAVASAFNEKLLARLSALSSGYGWQAGVDCGPLINQHAKTKLQQWIKESEALGAERVFEQVNIASAANFFPITVLNKVTDEMPVAQHELFGPVIALQTFTDETEAIQRANQTGAGLAAYCYSLNIHRCQRLSQQLQYAMIGINEGIISAAVSPFGGINESGFGREGSHLGLAEYQYVKSICYGLGN